MIFDDKGISYQEVYDDSCNRNGDKGNSCEDSADKKKLDRPTPSLILPSDKDSYEQDMFGDPW